MPTPRSLELRGAHDLSLHALEWSAAGPPLLLLHGFGHHARVWDDVVERLSARERHRTLALDQRGHGDSGRDPRARYSHEALARDLACVAAALGPEPLVLVGHSMGAYGALHFAVAHPERVAALVLVDATADLRSSGTARMRFRRTARDPSFETPEAYARVLARSFPGAPAAGLERLARHGLRRRDDGRFALKLDPAFLRPRHGYDPSRDRESWAERESRLLWDALGRVACPTLVARGADSPLLAAETARRMAGALCCARLAEIPGAGHAVMLDAPAALAAAIDGFLCEDSRLASHARKETPMAEIVVRDEIAAPAEKVWDLIRDFGGIDGWAAGVESCSVEGEGVGAVRTLGMPGGLSLQERLESHDDAGRSFSYAIVGDPPLPFRNYLSTVKLAEAGPGRCAIEWTGRYDPNEGAEKQAENIVRGIYTGGIAAIKKRLGE